MKKLIDTKKIAKVLQKLAKLMNNYDQHLDYDEVFSIMHGQTLIINKKKVDNIKDLVQTVNTLVKTATRKIHIQVMDNKNNKIARTTTYRKIKSRSESRETYHRENKE